MKEKVYKNINGAQFELNEREYQEYYDREIEYENNLLEQAKELKIEEINKFRDQQFFEKLEAEDPIYIQAKLKREELDALTTIKKVKCYKIDKIIDPITKKTIKGEIDDSQQL